MEGKKAIVLSRESVRSKGSATHARHFPFVLSRQFDSWRALLFLSVFVAARWRVKVENVNNESIPGCCDGNHFSRRDFSEFEVRFGT